MEQPSGKCPWCGQLYRPFERMAHMRSHLLEVERFRQELHHEVEMVTDDVSELMAVRP
jgi:hypothetical protein